GIRTGAWGCLLHVRCFKNQCERSSLDLIAVIQFNPGDALAICVSAVFATAVHQKNLAIIPLDYEVLPRHSWMGDYAVRTFCSPEDDPVLVERHSFAGSWPRIESNKSHYKLPEPELIPCGVSSLCLKSSIPNPQNLHVL